MVEPFFTKSEITVVNKAAETYGEVGCAFELIVFMLQRTLGVWILFLGFIFYIIGRKSKKV